MSADGLARNAPQGGQPGVTIPAPGCYIYYMKYFFRALPLCAVFVLFASCSGRITGQLAADASGTLQLEAGLEPNMTALVRSLGAFAAGGTGSAASSAPLLDAAALSRHLREAPGIASANLRNTGRERIEGAVGISRIGDLLSAGASRFVRYEGNGASGRLSVHLDRNIAPGVLSQISPEAVDYLAALMAPAATGEALSKAEYLGLVESVYGKGVTGEIAASRITAAITLPNTVKSVKGGTSSGREARFDIPLLDILVLEQPLDYEAAW